MRASFKAARNGSRFKMHRGLKDPPDPQASCTTDAEYAQAAALILPIETDVIVFRICEAIW